jgi:hypothetical protein
MRPVVQVDQMPGHGFLKKAGVVARRAFYARRSNLQPAYGIASGWIERPALATTQLIGLSTILENTIDAGGMLDGKYRYFLTGISIILPRN